MERPKRAARPPKGFFNSLDQGTLVTSSSAATLKRQTTSAANTSVTSTLESPQKLAGQGMKRTSSPLEVLQTLYAQPSKSFPAGSFQNPRQLYNEIFVGKVQKVDHFAFQEGRTVSQPKRRRTGRDSFTKEADEDEDRSSSDTCGLQPPSIPEERAVAQKVEYRRLNPKTSLEYPQGPKNNPEFITDDPLQPLVRGTTPVEELIYDPAEPNLEFTAPTPPPKKKSRRQTLLDNLNNDRELIRWQRLKIARDAQVRAYIRAHPKWDRMGHVHVQQQLRKHKGTAIVGPVFTVADQPRDLSLQRSILARTKVRYVENRKKLVKEFQSRMVVRSDYFYEQVEKMIEAQFPMKVVENVEGDLKGEDSGENEGDSDSESD